jgi:hypothetical protein
VLVLLVVVVVVTLAISISIELVQIAVEVTLIIVASLGTPARLYPANNADLDTPVANGVVYPSESEYMSKGPVSAPAKVNVIKTVIFYVDFNWLWTLV